MPQRLQDRQGWQRPAVPVKLPLTTVWWGDCDDGGTPGNFSDDVTEPLILRQVSQISGGAPLPDLTDDDGDGEPKVNRLDEIAL